MENTPAMAEIANYTRFEGMNFPQILDEQAQTYPDKEWLVFGKDAYCEKT